METLFDLLQKDFCPPLDSSLIAALLVELESDLDGNTVSPSQDQIDDLYATCSALALQAEKSQQSEFSGSQILQSSQISSYTTSDYSYEQSPSSGSGSTSSSDMSQHSFGSPLGFLQAALPDVPTSRLRRALLHAKKENTDMWDIVANILTEKSILEMDEIGSDGLVKSKKKPSTKAVEKKIQSQSNKIVLSDIRQQHHRPSPSRTTNITGKRPTVGATPDPWTQISSLSTHIASLIPPHPPSFFQSFFHSPIYTTSYDAVRAALMSLCENKQDAANYTTIVSNIMDILSLDNDDVDSELKARRAADIRLSVTVADGRATEALDLVNVLRDLDTRPDMGLSHLLPAQVSNSNGGVNPSVLEPPLSPTSGDEHSPDQWHIVRSSPKTRFHMPSTCLPLENSNPGEIDLHGLCVKEAIIYAEKCIQLAKSNGESQVKLIVGKGRHSQGGVAKIKPAIKELIQKHKLVAQLDPNNSGVLIVYLDSRSRQGIGPGYCSSQTRH